MESIHCGYVGRDSCPFPFMQSGNPYNQAIPGGESLTRGDSISFPGQGKA